MKYFHIPWERQSIAYLGNCCALLTTCSVSCSSCQGDFFSCPFKGIFKTNNQKFDKLDLN